MWVYDQRSGRLRHNGVVIAVGYAGCGIGKNNPLAQSSQGSDPARKHHHCSLGAGPLPKGFYTIGQLKYHGGVGSYSMPLVPDHKRGMFGRNGFYIHGPNRKHMKSSSDGCIILRLDARVIIWTSRDHRLEVIK